MDGTTAGRIDLGPPAPQPNPTPSGGDLYIGHAAQPAPTPSAQAAPLPAVPSPVIQTPPVVAPLPTTPELPTTSTAPQAPQIRSAPQPQFSQLTPVYAPTPTNTPADIAQPARKGIEFTVPASPSGQPLPPPPPPPPPMPPMPAPTPPVVPSPPQQSGVPPMGAPVTNSLDGIVPPPPAALPKPTEQASTANPARFSQLEGRLQDVDLDQMVGGDAHYTTPTPTLAPEEPQKVEEAAPVPVVENSAPAPEPTPVPVVPEPAPVQPDPAPAAAPQPPQPPEPAPPDSSVYFQNTFQDSVRKGFTIQSILPANLNTGLVKRIALIVAGVVVLGVAAYFIGNSIITNNNAREALAGENAEDPFVEQPVIEEPIVEAPVVDTPIVDPEPEPTTPAPSVPTVPDFTEEEPEPEAPVVTDGVPTTPNSGVSDADVAKRPKTLTIDSLGINAPIERVGVTSTGAMDVPDSIWNAGWYIGSAQPGNKGAVFLDGHSTESRNGLFGYLDTIRVGATIKVERNDGVTLRYKVAKVEIVDRNNVDMAKMLRPYDSTKQGLNIMSCIGGWIESEQTLKNRVLVYAVAL